MLDQAHVADALLAFCIEYDRERAARAWARAVELDPADPEARALRAAYDLVYARGAYRDAIREIEVALALIPSLDLTGHGMLARLATHEDFFLAEAVADEIVRRPEPALAAIAALCAAHAHPQASSAGHRALRALGR